MCGTDGSVCASLTKKGSSILQADDPPGLLAGDYSIRLSQHGALTAWTVPRPDPVIPPGGLHPGLDDGRAGAAHVVQDGDRYRMVYWGSDDAARHYILQAESPVGEPNRWQPCGSPLIGPQPETVHNFHGPGFPFLLPVTDSRWLLYFCAWGKPKGGKLPNTTGVAVSDDGGATWRYHSEHPIIPPDRPYDAEGSGSVWVLHDNGLFRMYYTSIGRYYPRPEGARRRVTATPSRRSASAMQSRGTAYTGRNPSTTW